MNRKKAVVSRMTRHSPFSQLWLCQPSVQSHLYEPRVLIHVPLFSHGEPAGDSHSNLSKLHQQRKKHLICSHNMMTLGYWDFIFFKSSLPISHTSPIHPSKHSQEYDPTLLTHVPLFWHGYEVHSSLSVKTVLLLKFKEENPLHYSSKLL